MIVANDYLLAEGPVYDCRTKALYFTDILAGRLLIRKDENRIRSMQFDDYVTSVHLTDRPDTVLVTTRDSLVEVNAETGSMRTVITLHLDPSMRFNDGAIAPDGSLFMGSMRIDGPRKDEGSLYRITRGGFEVILDKCGIPNGLGFISSNEFIHIDSISDSVSRYSLKEGRLRLIKRIRLDGQCPDGLCLDRDGHVLSALWNTGQLCILDASTLAEEKRISGFKTSLSSVCLTDDGRMFLTSGEDSSGKGCLYMLNTDMKKKEDYLWKTEQPW